MTITLLLLAIADHRDAIPFRQIGDVTRQNWIGAATHFRAPRGQRRTMYFWIRPYVEMVKFPPAAMRLMAAGSFTAPSPISDLLEPVILMNSSTREISEALISRSVGYFWCIGWTYQNHRADASEKEMDIKLLWIGPLWTSQITTTLGHLGLEPPRNV
jgi:hypothetical protein